MGGRDGKGKDAAPPGRSTPAPADRDDEAPSYRGKSLTTWIAQLQAKNAKERWEAAQALGNLDFRGAEGHREKALEALGRALGDRDGTLRFAAAGSLACYGQHAVPVFLGALKHADARVRRQAVEGLERFGAKGFRGRLIIERPGAFPVRPESYLPALADVLRKDKDAEVRKATARALAEAGRPAVPLLDAAAKSGDVEARKLAVGALGRIRKPAVPALIGVLRRKSEDAEVRLLAVRALGQIRAEARQAVPALAELLKENDEDLRTAGAEVLGNLGDEAGEALPALLTASKCRDDSGKVARQALDRIRKAPRSAAPALLPLLKDPEPYVRLKAIEALCELEEGDKECLAALLELVKRRDSKVRQHAARLLYRYGSAAKQAVPALMEVVRNDADPQSRILAIGALGAIGPDAKAAIPLLKSVQEDKQLTFAVQAALKKIEP
jgi:HEAT repeat protein